MTIPPVTAAAPPADPRRTEGLHPAYPDLDRLDLPSLVRAFTDDQRDAVEAVRAAAPALARAVGE